MIKIIVYCAISVLLLMPGIFISSMSETLYGVISLNGFISGMAFLAGIFFTFAFKEFVEIDKEKHRGNKK